ncbi:MAG: hypothetical protein CVV44_19095 [Spirochaetae bacterium HGW-Spirochaetae-1]|nr:MAG: hypothetical protein CVV44_19095 [Spirochaetae bacterium HGW-Spirochaetae-1]
MTMRMTMYRKSFAVIFPLMLVMSLTTCTDGASGRDPGTLYTLLGAEPGTLNPVIASDAYEAAINGHIYETLLDMNRDTLEMEPDLAERWDISPDKRRFRFYLKKNVVWSDGVPFTADDVVYSFKVIMDPKTANAHRKVNYIEIEAVNKVNSHTVDFIYKKQYFLALRICGGMTIIPKHIFDDGTDINTHKNNRHPVGTGPYVFSNWVTGSRIVLAVNERFRDKKPEIKRIVYRVIPEVNVALQMAKKGELDLMAVRPIQWVRQTDSEKFNKEFYKLKYYTPNYSYIAWNTRFGPFSDRRVRQAFGYLINRDAILEKLLFGLGERVTGTFYKNGRYYNKNLVPREYNPAKGRDLLKAAGWTDSDNDGILDRKGEKFSFTFTISSGSKFAERLASILKEDFSKAGIEMNINRYEWAVFVTKLTKRDFEAVTLSWSLGYNEDPYDLWHSSQMKEGFNFTGFHNAEADRIMEEGRKEFNAERRTVLFRRLGEILYEEQPYTFMFCSPDLVIASRRFGNVKVHQAGLNMEEWTVADDSGRGNDK